MALPFLELEKITVKKYDKTILNNLNLTINDDDCFAVVGSAGSGKTTLIQTIAGKNFHHGRVLFNAKEKPRPKIVVVDQQHRFKNLSNVDNFYYQQRYNSSEADDALTVAEVLKRNNDIESVTYSERVAEIAAWLHIDHLFNKPLLLLSNGENKRLQIANALLQDPEFLILDQPFIGLDADGRTLVKQILSSLPQRGIKLLLTTSAEEIPGFVTHVAHLDQGRIVNVFPAASFKSAAYVKAGMIDETLLQSIPIQNQPNFNIAVKMKNVNIAYGDRHILKNIDWEIKKGEHWSVSGPNGAGKSTLLSLIVGDNPKAYANDIYLFDKKRGSGESIWDIKRKIGYISPEMHLFFDFNATVYDTVASGIFDSIGLFRKLTNAQNTIVEKWMEILDLKEVSNQRLSQISTGKQRYALLARALVKQPPLLILDEPCQGLDRSQTEQFRQLIDAICKHIDTTLVYVSHYKEEIPECVNKHLKIVDGQGFEL